MFRLCRGRLFCLIVLGLFLTAGCASNPEAVEPDAVSGTYPSVEEELIPALLPRTLGFPGEIPLPGGEIWMPEEGALPSSVLVILTSSSPEEANVFYQNLLEEEGWEVFQTAQAGNQEYSLDALKEDQELYAIMGLTESGATEIVLMTGPSG